MRKLRVLGDQIRRLRNQSGLNGKQLADIVGTSDSYIYQIERGSVRPSLQLLEDIAEALDVDPLELIEGAVPHQIDTETRTIRELLANKLPADAILVVAEHKFDVPIDILDTVLNIILAHKK